MLLIKAARESVQGPVAALVVRPCHRDDFAGRVVLDFHVRVVSQFELHALFAFDDDFSVARSSP